MAVMACACCLACAGLAARYLVRCLARAAVGLAANQLSTRMGNPVAVVVAITWPTCMGRACALALITFRNARSLWPVLPTHGSSFVFLIRFPIPKIFPYKLINPLSSSAQVNKTVQKTAVILWWEASDLHKELDHDFRPKGLFVT